MRIGVNAVPMRVCGGGARYVFTELMERLLDADTANEYVIFTHFLGLRVINQLSQVHRHLRPGRPPRVRIIEVSSEDDIFNYRHEFDLFYGPLNNLQPRLYDRPSVAVLHDIQEQFFPEYFSEGDLAARREIYPEICRSATVLVTISEFCKQTFVDKFGIDPAKIEVVYNAPQVGLVDRAPDDRGTWSRAPVPDGFLFYPANCYRHKNHALLLDGLVEWRRRRGNCPPAVFTGFEVAGGFPLRAQIAQRGLDDVCHVHTEVSADELRYLFCHARALVMPTRFEGFGLPAAEAQACGCPVVASDLPVLHEVAGDHALYFDPDDRDALLAQLERLEREPDLRAELIEHGRAAAARFTWNKAAERTREIFELAQQRYYQPVAASVHQQAPRIGYLIRAARGSHGVPEAIKQAWATGYRQLAVRVELIDGEDYGTLPEFLTQMDVAFRYTPAASLGGWSSLSDFAEDERLDLVSEVLAGTSEILPTAPHSLAWGYQSQPDEPVYLGEAWESEHGRVARAARLRLLHTGDWRLEGYLYPEMLGIAPAAVAAWPTAHDAITAAGRDWRWALIKLAHQQQRRVLLRRTLAICDPSSISLMERLRTLRHGVGGDTGSNGHVRGGGWLYNLKPILRPASKILPGRWREKGKRIWRHLVER